MNLIRVAEHTVDLELLPEAPIVLDAGSRGFDFTNALRKLRSNAKVVAIEADPTLQEQASGVIDLHFALVGSREDSNRDYYHFPRGGFANSLELTAPAGSPCSKVQCCDITWIMSRFAIMHWDLVKLDIEGSEFEVLENWPGPIATQITVEFHDYFAQDRWNQDWFDAVLKGPLRDYEPVQNEKYAIGSGCFGHWDSLFVLRGQK